MVGGRLRKAFGTCALLLGLAAAPAQAATFADPFATYADTVRADGPTAYWRLGEDAGTTAADASGHNRPATYARDAEQLSRWGALGSDEDRAIESWFDLEGEPVPDLLSGPAQGLPAGARTVEAWVRTAEPGARVLRYGDFTVEIGERAIEAGDRRFTLAPGDRRQLHDGRWRHVVVTYDGTDLRAFLDGAAVGDPQAAELTTDTSGTFSAAAPTFDGAGYDELAIYPRALDAAAVAAHFEAAGNQRPAAITGFEATPGENRIEVTYEPVAGSHPIGQPVADEYVVEAWQGNTLRARRTLTASPPIETRSAGAARRWWQTELSGVPAGVTRVTMHAVGAYGTGPSTTLDATVTGAATTYASAITDAAPTVYWRLADTGRSVSDLSGHDLGAVYEAGWATTGALVGVADDAVHVDGYGGEPADLIRARAAAGLPTGDRTVEAWVRADAAGAGLLRYGDFTVELEEYAVVVSGHRIPLPAGDRRRLTDGRWHHVAVTYADGRSPRTWTARRWARRPPRSTSPASGELIAGHAPAETAVALDELALYPRALDAATIAARFAASGHRAPGALEGVTATAAANRATLRWTALEQEPVVDDVWLEARRGGVLQATRVTSGDATSLDLTGLEPGRYELRVRALNAYGEGPTSALDVDVTGTAATFPARLLADQPDLYWRLGDRGGTIVPDLSGQGRDGFRGAEQLQPVDGALVGDDDSAASTSGSWSWRGTTLARLPKAEGLPTAARTVEAWVHADVPGVRVIEYGDFSVDARRARRWSSPASGSRCRPTTPRRSPTPAGTTSRSRTRTARDRLPRRRRARLGQPVTLGHEHRRDCARRPSRPDANVALRRARALPARARRRHDRRALRRLRQRPARRARRDRDGGPEPRHLALAGADRRRARRAARGRPLRRRGAPGRARARPRRRGTEATLGGLPAGTTTVTVRAFNGFGRARRARSTSPCRAPRPPTPRRSPRTRPAVLAARRAQRLAASPTPPATATAARTWQDFTPYAGTGALADDPDGGFADGSRVVRAPTI